MLLPKGPESREGGPAPGTGSDASKGDSKGLTLQEPSKTFLGSLGSFTAVLCESSRKVGNQEKVLLTSERCCSQAGPAAAGFFTGAKS